MAIYRDEDRQFKLAGFLTAIGTITLTGCFASAFSDNPAHAQITPDTTLGAENSVVIPNTSVRGLPAELIKGGALRGTNLFHSFGEFNVGNGQRVYFANPTGIENILSRITGNTLSNILGTLGVDGSANLFLLNPNGIIFGQNAKLDIAGSFVGSTANSFVFDNGYQFSATNPQVPSILTIKVTPGLQYGTNQPKTTITNTGNLAVGANQTLTLHGGTVTNTGSLTAKGGKVQVLGNRIGLFDHAQIDVSAPGGGGIVLIGGDFQGKGEVPNATQTFVGSNVTINADAIGNGNGGRVIIWSNEATRFYGNITARGGANSGKGGFVEVSGKQYLDYNGFVNTYSANGAIGTLLLDPTNIEVVAVGGETGNLLDVDAFADPNLGTPGDTTLNVAAINNAAANVILQATNNITFNATVTIFNPGVGLTAQAGNNITVNSPITTSGGAIQFTANDATSGAASGNGSIFINANIQSLGGAIALRAGGDILVSGANVLTRAGFFGDSGNLNIDTGRLTVQNFGTLSTGTFGFGNAGTINIRASEIDLIAPTNPIARLTGISAIANPGSTGNAGNITIETGRLTARNGAQISAGTVGSGRAGDINVRASDIELTGVLSANGFPTGILADSNAGSTRNAGTITIETGSLITRDGGGVFVSTESAGNGGALNIKASSIELSGNGTVYPSGLIAQAFPGSTGNAGQMTINTGRLRVQDRAVVTTDASIGRAGNLLIQATDSIDILNRGFLIAVSDGMGAGGNIAISTRNLTLQNGFISSSANNQGNGGNIAINSLESVRIAGNSFISTGTFGSGSGGNVLIETGTFTLTDQGSIFTSSLNQGNAGNLTLRSTNAVNLTDNGILSTANFGTGAGGTMEIQTGQLLVQGQAQVTTQSVAGNAGDLSVRATEFVNLDGGDLLAISTATGSGGNIAIDTRNLTLQNGAAIGTATIDRGNAGNITINSLESVTVGNESVISALSFGSGTGGFLSINTGTLTIRDKSGVYTSTAGQGNAGNLTVNAANAVNVIDSGVLSTGTVGTGAGGNLLITTRILNIQNFGRVFTSSLDASTYDLSILDPNVYSPDVIALIRNIVNTADQGDFTQGSSGNLRISATDSVNVANSGSLATLAFGKASGGFLSLETGQLTIQGDAVVSSSAFGQGNGGDIELKTNSFTLTTSGLLASRSEGSGSAGDMIINVRDDLRSSQGDIVATSDRAGGGNINIRARDIRLQDGSLISTSVFDSTGGGGNITINSETLVLLGDTDILANAAAGPGGDITINSPAFLVALFSTNQATPVGRNPGDLNQFRGNNRVDISDNFIRIDDSDRIPILGAFDQFRGNNRTDISTASQSGSAGILRNSTINNTQPVSQIPLNLVNPEELIDRHCTPKSSAQRSSFTITGRGGLPTNPNEVLQGENVITNWVTLDDKQENRHGAATNINPASPASKQLVEAQGWVITPNGQVILTAQANTATPQTPGIKLPSCQELQETNN